MSEAESQSIKPPGKLHIFREDNADLSGKSNPNEFAIFAEVGLSAEAKTTTISDIVSKGALLKRDYQSNSDGNGASVTGQMPKSQNRQELTIP